MFLSRILQKFSVSCARSYTGSYTTSGFSVGSWKNLQDHVKICVHFSAGIYVRSYSGHWIHAVYFAEMFLQYRHRTQGTALRLVDRGLTPSMTVTANNQPSVSTRFYLINSNCGHAVGVVQIRGWRGADTRLAWCRYAVDKLT